MSQKEFSALAAGLAISPDGTTLYVANYQNLRPFRACSSRRFETDAGGAAEYDNGLPEELRFALNETGSGCGAHDSSD